MLPSLVLCLLLEGELVGLEMETLLMLIGEGSLDIILCSGEGRSLSDAVTEAVTGAESVGSTTFILN